MRIANTLIREMAIHGDAEEISYYNFLEKHEKSDVVKHNKEKHHEINVLVYDADTTTAGPDFDQKLAKAFNAFDTHAKKEEETILPEMFQKMQPEENDAEARVFLKAPQSGGMMQKVASAQAATHDAIVNKLRGADFVSLKVVL
ncbi:hypothetical protein Clacol_003011 [Clathrus columnatus]|uniref:Hemerythrin-like domain-containing protein n=1 Tax=Clathrus columnatus TaxID=1419009 RepID=A0AAV5A2D2_9AGAM|nr:hypothetical protein Clacol_003011 [Clathrus columnatus]